MTNCSSVEVSSAKASLFVSASRSGVDGVSFVYIFRRSASAINTAPIGGVFSEGNVTTPPSGWNVSARHAPGNGHLFFSHGVVRRNVLDVPWSVPVQLDGADFFIYTQAAVSSLWVITHNLGRNPSVNVRDTEGNMVVGAVSHTNANTLEIRFLETISGTAYLI